MRGTLLHILTKSRPDPATFDPIHDHFSFLSGIVSVDLKNTHNYLVLAPNRPGSIKIELSVKFYIGWTNSHQNPVVFSQFAILLAPLLVTPDICRRR